jgi:hypothetical protein
MTVAERSRPNGLDVGPIAILVLFAVQMMLWGGLGLQETTRMELLRLAAAQLGVFAIGLGWLVARARAQGALPSVRRHDRPVVIVLATWASISTLAALEGLLARQPLLLVLGDYYKFASLVLFFALTYWALETEAQVAFVMRALPVLFGVILVFDFIRYYPVLSQGVRFTSNAVHHIAIIAPLICYQLVYAPSRSHQFLVAIVFAETLLAMSWGQELGAFVAYLLSLGTLFVMSGRRVPNRGGRRTGILVGGLLAVVATLGINLHGGIPIAISGPHASPPSIGAPPAGSTPAGVVRVPDYVRNKVEAATTSPSRGKIVQIIDVIGGSRGAEIATIVRTIARNPRHMLLGFGLGGTLTPIALSSIEAFWEHPKHYIHAGLFEVLYRAGFAGFLTMVALLGLVFVWGARLAGKGHSFAIFVMTVAMVEACLLAYYAALTTPYLLLAIAFAGASVLQCDALGDHDRSS